MFFGSARVDSRERAERALAALGARGDADAPAEDETERTRANGRSSGRGTTRTRASWRAG